MTGHLRIFATLILGFLFLSGCAISQKTLVQKTDPPRKIAVFFDGTSSDERSDTNVKKLHSLVTLQKSDDIPATYIEGVGADGRFIGMGTGWGIGKRVRLAYTFLLKTYRKGDEIYIFGFSRGAYSGRILASLLYHAGLPNVQKEEGISPEEVSRIVYDSFKGDKSDEARRNDVERALIEQGLLASPPITVTALGLWDTVEALGWPKYKVNIDVPNKHYGDQLCNVERAYHAVSIDDDRERIFTPILLTRRHFIQECQGFPKVDISAINKKVEEVWFLGAHGDVGGRYEDTLMGGVSLNWMIRKLKGTKLLPENAAVPENRFGETHDPEGSFPFNILYKKQSRDLRKYTESSIYNEHDGVKRLKLHRSVIDRLAGIKPKDYEYQWLNAGAYPECFEISTEGYRYNKDSKCFDIVE